MLYDRVKYILYYAGLEAEVEEPVNWDDDEKTFARNKTYHGIVIDLTDQLEFIGEGREFLIAALETGGVNADVRCTRWERNTQTDVYEIDYIAWIDFTTYDIGEENFRVKFNADPLTTLFKAKLTTEVELERLTSLTNGIIPPLPLETLYIDGRAIKLTSKLTQNIDPGMQIRPLDGNSWKQSLNIHEVGVDGNLDAGVIYVTTPNVLDQTRYNSGAGDTGETFLLINDSLYDLTYDINIDLSQSIYVEGTGDFEFRVELAIFENDISYDLKETKVLWEYPEGPQNLIPKEIYTKLSEKIVFAPGESAALRYYTNAPGTGHNAGSVWWQYPWDNPNSASGYQGAKGTYINSDGDWAPAFYNCSVTVREDSERKHSSSPCIKIYEFAKRLNDIILEEGFESDLLANADISDTVLLHGMWLRGLAEGVEGYKPISTSLKNFLSSLDGIYPIGVDVVDNKLVIEAREHFYQNRVTVDLGEVSDLHIQPSTKDMYGTIIVGPRKSGKYEEEDGLDEFNRRTSYDTILNKMDNTLDLTTQLKTDSIGLETVRRDNPLVGLNVAPDKDSKFDDDIWFVDAEEVADQTSLEVSGWQKRFAVAPTGLYSVETAFNIWYSPINILLRHGPWIKPALLKYIESYLSYSSSDGNSSLTTQLIDGEEYSQNIGVPVEDLDRSIHKGQLATFKAPVKWRQLTGKTDKVKNVHGQFQFTRYGITYRAFLENVKLKDGIGEFEVKMATSISSKSTTE